MERKAVATFYQMADWQWALDVRYTSTSPPPSSQSTTIVQATDLHDALQSM